jgi:type IV fimbrial biogenesis protein FimT
MTAELLGTIAVFGTYARAALVAMLERSLTLHVAMPAQANSRAVTHRVPRRERGFTMSEMMVAVGVVAILTAVAAPPMLAMIASQRVKTATFNLYSAMSYARSEAIKRNAVVTVSPRNGAFSNGYDLMTGGSVLRSQQGDAGVSISAPAGLELAFDGYGRLTVPSRYQLELTYGRIGATPKRCVVVSTTGRPTIASEDNPAGICISG